MSPAFSETFTLVSRGVTGQDGDGNDVFTETQTPVKGAFAPEGSTELVQGQTTVLTHPRLYLDPGQPVPLATDQIVARGLRYDVDGDPGVFVNVHTGRRPGAVVDLLKVTG